MAMEKNVQLHMELCIRQVNTLEKKLETLPPGKLKCYRNGKYCTYKVILPDKSCRYIPKSETDYLKKLALRLVYCAQLADLKADIEGCRSYLRYIESVGGEFENLMSTANDGFLKLITGCFNTQSEQLSEWVQAPYKSLEKFRDQLIVKTLRGDMVRSKSEAVIADELYTMGIPYRYEALCRVGGKEIYPDFTAIDERTGRTIIIEFFGMMDNSGYLDGYLYKMDIYVRNGYIPDDNLICFYERQGNPINRTVIRQRLEQFFLA